MTRPDPDVPPASVPNPAAATDLLLPDVLADALREARTWTSSDGWRATIGENLDRGVVRVYRDDQLKGVFPDEKMAIMYLSKAPKRKKA